MPGLETLGTELWIFFIAVIVGGGIVHGTLGMGFPLVATALLSLIMDVKEAVFLSLVPSIFINLICMKGRGDWKKGARRFLPLALIAGIASAVGARYLLIAPAEPVKLLLVVSIFLYLMTSRLRKTKITWIEDWPTLALLFFGGLAGLVGGITNAMGPILVVYFIEGSFSTEETVQGLNISFLVGKLAQLAIFAKESDAFQHTRPAYVIMITLLSILALWVGIRIRQRVSQETYRRCLKIALFVIALVLTAQVVTA